MPGPITELKDNLAYRMATVSFALAREVARSHGAEGLTTHQWKVLSILCHGSPMRASQIEPLVTLDKSAISRNLRLLEEEELIRYLAIGPEKGARFIEPTKKGRKIHESVSLKVSNLQRRLLRGMAESDVKALFRALDHLEQQLRTQACARP